MVPSSDFPGYSSAPETTRLPIACPWQRASVRLLPYHEWLYAVELYGDGGEAQRRGAEVDVAVVPRPWFLPHATADSRTSCKPLAYISRLASVFGTERSLTPFPASCWPRPSRTLLGLHRRTSRALRTLTRTAQQIACNGTCFLELWLLTPAGAAFPCSKSETCTHQPRV